MPYQTYAALVLWTAAAGLPGAAAAQAAEQPAREQLEGLRSRAQALEESLRGTLTERGGEEAALKRLDLALGRTARELHALEARRPAIESREEHLRGEGERLREQLTERRRRVAALARAAVAVGRERGLAAVLGGADEAATGRVVAYIAYLQSATVRELESLARSQAELAGLEQALAEQTRRLDARIAETHTVRRRLAARRATRARLLARLNLRVLEQRETLVQVQRDEARLRALVAGLDTRERALPAPPAFGASRGALPWPVRGRLRHRFGTPRSVGHLTWQGVWVDAPLGASVRAVWHGRVAFADWFRGFGLMLIIDHGEGFMSLYGHNEALLKDTGEWVDTGDAVATVGQGTARASGLYFEVRHQGVPQDPLRWLRARPRSLVRR